MYFGKFFGPYLVYTDKIWTKKLIGYFRTSKKFLRPHRTYIAKIYLKNLVMEVFVFSFLINSDFVYTH